MKKVLGNNVIAETLVHTTKIKRIGFTEDTGVTQYNKPAANSSVER
jgi:hypothetical protein